MLLFVGEQNIVVFWMISCVHPSWFPDAAFDPWRGDLDRSFSFPLQICLVTQSFMALQNYLGGVVNQMPHDFAVAEECVQWGRISEMGCLGDNVIFYCAWVLSLAFSQNEISLGNIVVHRGLLAPSVGVGRVRGGGDRLIWITKHFACLEPCQ